VMVWDGRVTHPGLAHDSGREVADAPWRAAA
jgi:hypothetical protein